MVKLLSKIPKPLLDDIVQNHCIPIIGAGFSKNAILPPDKSMPLWDELGIAFAKEIDKDYPYTTAIDAISAYDFEFTTVKMVEKLADLLHIKDARPGPVHKAFSKVPFDIVVTTNFDCLLEKAYDATRRYCHKLISEQELAVNPPDKSIILLKFHGDFSQPDRLVVTERNYASFLGKYPLISTYLSNLLISRTPLFIGYSLGDSDFQQIREVIRDRLGELRRPAYTVLVNSSKAQIRRFERKDVKVINLTSPSSSYGELLTKLFDELQEYWTQSELDGFIPTKEDVRKEFSTSRQKPTRLCLFSIPYRLMSFFVSNVFPIAELYGFVPFTLDDVFSPSENIVAKEMALFERIEVAVIDGSSMKEELDTISSLRSKRPLMPTLLMLEPDFVPPFELQHFDTIILPKDMFVSYQRFLDNIEAWFKKVSETLSPQLDREPLRLLETQEYRAAFISAISLLESELRKFIVEHKLMKNHKKPMGLYMLYKYASPFLNLTSAEDDDVYKWIEKRNTILHKNSGITSPTAQNYIRGILNLIEKIKRESQRINNCGEPYS